MNGEELIRRLSADPTALVIVRDEDLAELEIVSVEQSPGRIALHAREPEVGPALAEDGA